MLRPPRCRRAAYSFAEQPAPPRSEHGNCEGVGHLSQPARSSQSQRGRRRWARRPTGARRLRAGLGSAPVRFDRQSGLGVHRRRIRTNWIAGRPRAGEEVEVVVRLAEQAIGQVAPLRPSPHRSGAATADSAAGPARGPRSTSCYSRPCPGWRRQLLAHLTRGIQGQTGRPLGKVWYPLIQDLPSGGHQVAVGVPEIFGEGSARNWSPYWLIVRRMW